MKFLSYNPQDCASFDKGHSNPFLIKDIFHVKSLEKLFNRPNDTPSRRWDTLKKIVRENLISLTTNNFLKIS